MNKFIGEVCSFIIKPVQLGCIFKFHTYSENKINTKSNATSFQAVGPKL